MEAHSNPTAIGQLTQGNVRECAFMWRLNRESNSANPPARS